VGAIGLISWNAHTLSSSNTIFDGISPRISLQNKQSSDIVKFNLLIEGAFSKDFT
jgi:hypothetical protein